MEKDYILLIVISILSLAYSIFYLVKGKNVKVVCNGSNKFLIYIVYFILAALILFKNNDNMGVITAALLLLSGVIYSLVPSGYDEKGIYLRGRFFSYNKITQMDFDYVNNYYQLSFFYHGRCRLLIGNKEDKEKLKGAYYCYKELHK